MLINGQPLVVLLPTPYSPGVYTGWVSSEIFHSQDSYYSLTVEYLLAILICKKTVTKQRYISVVVVKVVKPKKKVSHCEL